MAIDARLQEQVTALRQESLGQSLANLSDIDAYVWPGPTLHDPGIPVFPLHASVGQHDVVAVLSSRRFLKVLHELSGLRKSRATALVREHLRLALADYRQLFADCLRQTRRALAPDVAEFTPVVFQISNNADGSPTLMGAKYRVLALALLAGNLGLTGAAPEVLDAVREARAGYRDLASPDRYHPVQAYSVVYHAGLYNRQSLAAALLQTASNRSLAERAFQQSKAEWASIDLTRFDALATPFDLHGRIGAAPVDLSAGKQTVRFLRNVSDEGFDAILGSFGAAN